MEPTLGQGSQGPPGMVVPEFPKNPNRVLRPCLLEGVNNINLSQVKLTGIWMDGSYLGTIQHRHCAPGLWEGEV